MGEESDFHLDTDERERERERERVALSLFLSLSFSLPLFVAFDRLHGVEYKGETNLIRFVRVV